MGLTARLRRASLWRLLAMLLLPLLALVTGVELWMTRHDALEAANAAYDRSLLGALKSIDANISTASGGLSAGCLTSCSNSLNSRPAATCTFAWHRPTGW